MSISAVIITYQEEDKIEDCILSLKEVCDDIVVVDAESSDKTVSKAKSTGANVFIKKWEGYGAARNYGAGKAKNDWILSIDADERLNQPLQREIQNIELSNQVVYRFLRTNSYCGKWIKYGSLRPEWKSRIYNRNNSYWNNSPVHEQLVANIDVREQRLKGSLLHYAYKDHEEFVKKLKSYSLLFNSQNHKKVFLKRKMIQWYHFFKYFIVRLGFLEGRVGFKIDLAKSQYHENKYRSDIKK